LRILYKKQSGSRYNCVEQLLNRLPLAAARFIPCGLIIFSYYKVLMILRHQCCHHTTPRSGFAIAVYPVGKGRNRFTAIFGHTFPFLPDMFIIGSKVRDIAEFCDTTNHSVNITQLMIIAHPRGLGIKFNAFGINDKQKYPLQIKQPLGQLHIDNLFIVVNFFDIFFSGRNQQFIIFGRNYKKHIVSSLIHF